MKNNVSRIEERQLITKEFAHTLAGNTPCPTPAPLGSFANPAWLRLSSFWRCVFKCAGVPQTQVTATKLNIRYSLHSANRAMRGEVAWVAVLVEIDGNHYYSETYRKGQIEIEKWQYDRVLKNPEAAYFTTALELHFKLNRFLGIIGDSKP